MPVITYDYLPTPHIINGRLIAIYTPMVPIRLSASHKMYPYIIDCLLDSGADFNLFPAVVGEKMGLRIKKGRKTEHIGIGNIGITAYVHSVIPIFPIPICSVFLPFLILRPIFSPTTAGNRLKSAPESRRQSIMYGYIL